MKHPGEPEPDPVETGTARKNTILLAYICMAKDVKRGIDAAVATVVTAGKKSGQHRPERPV